MNDSSVSRFAEREFRLVEPNRVRRGSAVGWGRSQIPAKRRGITSTKCDRRRNESYPLRGMSSPRAPTRSAAPPVLAESPSRALRVSILVAHCGRPS